MIRLPAEVTLEWYEGYAAKDVARRRQDAAVKDGRKDKHGLDPSKALETHLKGVWPEQVVAKCFNRYWDGSVNTYKRKPDLDGVEIRGRSKHSYDLMIRTDDDPSKAYVLVTGTPPTFVVRGWIYGKDARRKEWWLNPDERGWAWFVPQSALHTDIPPFNEYRTDETLINTACDDGYRRPGCICIGRLPKPCWHCQELKHQ